VRGPSPGTGRGRRLAGPRGCLLPGLPGPGPRADGAGPGRGRDPRRHRGGRRALIPREAGHLGPGFGQTGRGCRRPTGHLHDRDGRCHVESPYFLTGSVRVGECPGTAAILVRILAYRDVDFAITLTESEGGEVELTIDGARELDDDRMTRLEG